MISHHSRINHKTTKNIATAVPSLNKLSHSKRIVSLLGAHRDLNIERTATGSVAEINTQNNKQTKNGICNQTNGNKKNNANAIKNQEIINQKTDNEVIVFQLIINCL